VSTVDATGAVLANPLVTTAGASVCSACHSSATAKTHMTQNGAVFAAVAAPSAETCVVCHGPGTVGDVAVVHQLASFH
jgi:mono/diheme cytochrome c family protein